MDYVLIKGIIEKITKLKDELEKLYRDQEQESHEEFILKNEIAKKEEELQKTKKRIKELKNELEQIIQDKPLDPETYDQLRSIEKLKLKTLGRKVQFIIISSTIIALSGIAISIGISLSMPYLLGFLVIVTCCGILNFKPAYKKFKDQMFEVYYLNNGIYENKTQNKAFMQNRPDLGKKQEIESMNDEIENLKEEIEYLASTLEVLQLELQNRDREMYQHENAISQQENYLISLFEGTDLTQVLFNSKFSSEEQFIVASILTKEKRRKDALEYKNPNFN